MRLTARLFGGLEVAVGGQPIAADYELGPVLFAWLVLHPGRRFSRDEMAELLWPERKPGVGRRALREVLYRLRRTLRESERPDPLLEVDRDSVSLPRSEAWSADVTTFDDHVETVAKHAHRSAHTCLPCLAKLSAAVHLATGDLLHAVRLPPGGMEEAVARHRDQRKSQALAAWDAIGARAIDAEAWDEARAAADGMEALAPRHERALRFRMRALSAEGRKAARPTLSRCTRRTPIVSRASASRLRRTRRRSSIRAFVTTRSRAVATRRRRPAACPHRRRRRVRVGDSSMEERSEHGAVRRREDARVDIDGAGSRRGGGRGPARSGHPAARAAWRGPRAV